MRVLWHITVGLMGGLLLILTVCLWAGRLHRTGPSLMLVGQGQVGQNDWRLVALLPNTNYQRPLTPAYYDTHVLDWSGEWLYFSGHPDGGVEMFGNQLRTIYRIRQGENQAEQLTPPVIIRGVRWSNEWLVYPHQTGRNRTDLYGLKIPDGLPQNLTESLPYGINMRRLPPVISIDGAWLIFYARDATGRSGEIYAMRWDGSDLFPVTINPTPNPSPHAGRAFNMPVCSPSPCLERGPGGEVEFIATLDHQVYRIVQAAVAEKLTTTTDTESIAAWLPDHDILLVAVGENTVAVQPSDGAFIWEQPLRYLTVNATHVFLQSDSGHVVKMPLLGGELEQVAAEIWRVWDWTPDGKWLIFEGADGSLQRMDGQVVENLWEAVPRRVAQFVDWTPDGQWLIFEEGLSDGMALKMMRADGSDEHLLFQRQHNASYSYQNWTPPFTRWWSPEILGGGGLTLILLNLWWCVRQISGRGQAGE